MEGIAIAILNDLHPRFSNPLGLDQRAALHSGLGLGLFVDADAEEAR